MRVLLADLPDASMEAPLGEPLAGRHAVTRCSALDGAAFGAAIAEVEAVILQFTGLPNEVLEQAKSLRLVQKMGAGYDRIDVVRLTERGIPLAVTPAANAVNVAEHAVLLMLALGHGLIHQRERLLAGAWRDYDRGVRAVELYEATVGIVGLGAIGIEVARRAAGFGPRVIAVSRTPKPEIEQRLGIQRVAFEELLEQSDFVVLACPLTPETRGLIDARAIARMKPRAFLVNVARGPVIDEAALVAALQSGRIGGAGLDVFSIEPAAPDNPLLRLPNVLATPHVAGLSTAAQSRIWEIMADNLDRVERGESPQYVVNPAALKGPSD